MLKQVTKTGMIVGLLLSVSLAQAAEKDNFSCSHVGTTEEWRISIDLNKSLASFFDNDTTSVVPLINHTLTKKNNRIKQSLYVFAGEGYPGDPDSKLVIQFDEVKKCAQVTYFIDGEAKTLKAKQKCVVDPEVNLDIED